MVKGYANVDVLNLGHAAKELGGDHVVDAVDELIEGPLDTSWGEKQEGLKLDLACGANLRRGGYTGVDSLSLEDLIAHTPMMQGPDAKTGQDGPMSDYDGYVQADLLEFPWPFEEGSVAATFSSHFVEHIPHYIPGVSQNATDDGWWYFFKELYRVLEDGGIAEFTHPFSRSDRAFWDPTHTRYIHYQTWFYLGREQRIQLGVNHYAPEVDFEVLNIQTIHEPTLLEGRSAEVIDFARQFYFNPTDDLFVVLRANK